MEENKGLSIFEGKKIRKIWHKDEWYFSIFDIISTLTDSNDTKQYIKKMRQRDPILDANWGTICTPLEITALDGKKRVSNCVSTEGAFRIIQSIPSPKAEPFKLWLAKVGYERVKEIENPELAQKRMKEIYKAKGYSDDWIEKRVRGIAIRDELTDEWSKRDVKKETEYSILTAEISKATFGLTPSEYKDVKGLKRENLRDHMDDLELIFSMLGEKATTEIARAKDALGFGENKTAAKTGGKIAGDARKNLEIETGKNVVSSDNYLNQPEKIKRIEKRR